MQIDDIGAATSHDFKKTPKTYNSTASLFQEYAIFLISYYKLQLQNYLFERYDYVNSVL